MTLVLAVVVVLAVLKIRDDAFNRGYEQGRIVGVNAFRLSRGSGAEDLQPRRVTRLVRINGGAA